MKHAFLPLLPRCMSVAPIGAKRTSPVLGFIVVGPPVSGRANNGAPHLPRLGNWRVWRATLVFADLKLMRPPPFDDLKWPYRYRQNRYRDLGGQNRGNATRLAGDERPPGGLARGRRKAYGRAS